MDAELLRDWVRAEIEYELASRDTDEDGYRSSAPRERDHANGLFELIKKSLQ